MFDNDRISLLSSRSLVNYSIKRPFNGKNGHPNLITMINTDPPEANSLDSLLQCSINPKLFALLIMDQTDSNFSASIMFPQILAKSFTKLLNGLK